MKKLKKTTQEFYDEEPAAEEAAGEMTGKQKKRNIFTWALLIIALILCVFVISQVLSKGYISVGGYSLFRVASGSMEPELPVGALLISENTDIRDIQVGDIVNFHSKDNGMIDVVITHRVIGIHKDAQDNVYLETNGDANKYVDGAYVDAGNLIGKVVFYTGRGNVFAYLIQFLSSPLGFFICIVLPCLIVGVMVLRDTVSTMKKEIDSMQSEAEQEKKEQSEPESLERQMGEEAYNELCDQLRNELLEELKQNAAQVHTENQLDSQQQQGAAGQDCEEKTL